MSDPRGRKTVSDFLGDRAERLFHIGRLDYDTEGLMLLTNDGELAHVLAHPSFGVEKTYIAKVRGRVTPATLQRLKTGIELDDGPIHADRARILQAQGDARHTMVELTLHSGRNRIVRRMLDAVGHPVVDLVRRSFGPLNLGTLRSGAMRELTKVELGQLLTLSRAADAGRKGKR
ncbi:MAG TPA: pseudouridine synthase, partial [Agromyces mariniharenae]|nr:pseudouridine synthase [Agromyces mariniharenae]